MKKASANAEAFLQKDLVSVNANLLLALALVLKLNGSVDESKQRVVLANANVLTCANCASALSDDDVACQNVLTVRLLNAKALGLTVTAVLGRTYTFLMSKEL
jgi:hypothetical protein